MIRKCDGPPSPPNTPPIIPKMAAFSPALYETLPDRSPTRKRPATVDGFIPARRATTVDPLEAIKGE